MFAAPDKFGITAPAAPMLASWSSTDGKPAMQLEYWPGRIAAPDKVTATTLPSLDWRVQDPYVPKFDWLRWATRRRPGTRCGAGAGVRLGESGGAGAAAALFIVLVRGPREDGDPSSGNAEHCGMDRDAGEAGAAAGIHSRKLHRAGQVRDRDGGDADDCILELGRSAGSRSRKKFDRGNFISPDKAQRGGCADATVLDFDERPARGEMAAWPTPSFTAPGDWHAASAAILKAKRFRRSAS